MTGPYDVTWTQWALVAGASIAASALVLLGMWVREKIKQRRRDGSGSEDA